VSRVRRAAAVLTLTAAFLASTAASATAAGGGALYVTNTAPFFQSVVPIPLSTLSPGTPITSGIPMSPVAIAISPDASHAFTANGGAQSVSVIDTAPNSAVAVSNPSLTSPGSIAASPDGSQLYVGNVGGTSVVVLNAGTSQVPFPPVISVGSEPLGIAFTPDGRFAYVANQASGTVSVINTSSQTVTTTIPAFDLPNAPCALSITPDGAKIVVIGGCGSVSSGGIGIIDTATNTATTIAGDTHPYEAEAMAPDGTKAYVYDRMTGNIQVVDPRSGTIDGTPLVTGQGGIEGLAVSPDGRSLFATRSGSSSVSRIDTTTTMNNITPISISGSPTTPWADAITPDQAPHAAFSVTSGAPGAASGFDASATVTSDEGPTTYAWSFGDGSSATTATPSTTHVYSKPGAFTATLRVTDDQGCSTALVYTGQTASCNGGPSAQTAHQVTITKAPTPPNTRITKSKINREKRRARFKFKAIGQAAGLQCELKRKHAHRKAKFKGCKSPKAYKHLRKGAYTFAARAFNSAGGDPSPAKKRFRLK
jgi:YVTN family beta-propeller protein